MSPLLKFLWFIAVIVLNGHKVTTFSLAGSAKISNNSEEYGYYNIYSKIDSLQKAFQTLESSVQRKNNLLRQVLQTVTEMDDNMEMSDQSLNTRTLQTVIKNETAIGFTTKLSGIYSNSSSIIQGYTILYNGGNAYNGTVFTCPSPGLYLFHVSMLSNTRSGGIWIYKNSQQLTLAFAGNGDPQFNGASVSAAVWLDVGDQVYLRPYSSFLYLDHSSAFTGVKVN